MASIKKNQEVHSDDSWRERLRAKKALRGDIIKDVEETISNMPRGLSHAYQKLTTAKILFNRATSGMEKVSEDVFHMPNPPFKNTRMTSLRQKNKRRLIERGVKNRVQESTDNPEKPFIPSITLAPNRVQESTDNPEKPFSNSKFNQLEEDKNRYKNTVSLMNLSVSPYIKIDIQGMPRSIEVKPETSWATLKSPGKNTGTYQYSGSEDVITLEVSWYAVDENREDVINKCRLIESWSKSDGYASSPPLIRLLWGDSGIFSEHEYIVWSAKYTLSNFQRSTRKKGEVVNLKLLPNTATQTIELRRVSSGNITHEMIIPNNKLESTTGIYN